MKRYMMSGLGFVVVAAVVVIAGRHRDAQAHCQVPCGIYDDSARITRLLEDTTTIKRAMGAVNQLAEKSDAESLNQAVRWINTKEEHASHIIEVVSTYFLTQKVKDVAEDDATYGAYLERLAVHHRVMRAAMKAKQSTDPAVADQLNASIAALGQLYAK